MVCCIERNEANCAPMLSAFTRLIPLTFSSSCGANSMTSKVRSPKKETIFFALPSPIPLKRPPERYRIMLSLPVGGETFTLVTLNCSPKVRFTTCSPVMTTRSPSVTGGKTPTQITRLGVATCATV